jgi:hypothetical protein
MRLFLIPAKLANQNARLPHRVYLVAAPSYDDALNYLPKDVETLGFGEAEGTIDHPLGLVGWLGSRTPISIDGKS